MTIYWNNLQNYTVWIELNTERQFISLANICQNCETGKTSSLRWSPFKTNYRAESWVTATAVLEHESNSLKTTVRLCVCVFASQYNHDSSATAVLTIGSTTTHIHWFAVLIFSQEHNELFIYFMFLHILDAASVSHFIHCVFISACVLE